MTSVASALPWPLFTIDFEASSLEPGSFPIEVGVCRWLSPAAPIEGWSTLIQPADTWALNGTWSASAEQVHGIGLEELSGGMTPAATVSALNALIGNNAAFCDGGSYDFGWARRLVLAARVPNRFKLGDYEMLALRCDLAGRKRLQDWLARATPRHRARSDAERLMRALAFAQGLDFSGSENLSISSMC